MRWRHPGGRRLRSSTLIYVVAIALAFWVFLKFVGGSNSEGVEVLDPSQISLLFGNEPGNVGAHTIDALIHDSYKLHTAQLSKATFNVRDAAQAYRKRRRRHPPPGFDTWYARAQRQDAVVVEDYFDRIYEDLEPFWGVSPSSIRGSVVEWAHVLSVRNGKVDALDQSCFNSRVWGDMLSRIARDLPDLDFAINPLAEPRVIAPWREVNAAVSRAAEQKQRMMALPSSEVLQRMPQFRPSEPLPGHWVTKGSYANLLAESCSGRDHNSEREFYVSNWTDSNNLCTNPHLAKLHGALIEPASLNVFSTLIPIFSAAKFQGNNDILLPPAAYYSDKSLSSGSSSSIPWTKKSTGLIWRGEASGGVSHEKIWQQFHRHRFVSVLNGSTAKSFIGRPDFRNAWDDQDGRTAYYALLPKWLRKTCDIAFTDLLCSGRQSEDPETCKTISDHYKPTKEIFMSRQYAWKYLPDIDGASFSDRFMAVLRSNSAIMKSTLFKEWHDSRLQPWVHFIPVQISFSDLWTIMQYFIGFADVAAHDAEGRAIALLGREWAGKALRREDMEIYLHRLLLEYARVCDEEREVLGYVADLLG